MTVMEGETEILKADEAGGFGHRRRSAAALLAEYDRSGMTGAQSARYAGVRYPTLMNWLQGRRRAGAAMASCFARALWQSQRKSIPTALGAKRYWLLLEGLFWMPGPS
jgi:hypothetical protein